MIHIEDNFFTENELKEVKEEVKLLYRFRKRPDQTGTATHKQNSNDFKKTGQGVFLYDLYYDPNDSPSLKYYDKIFKDVFTDKLIKEHILFKHIKQSTRNSVLLNYYGNHEEYKPHTDDTCYTALVMLKIGDIQGGDLEFPELKQIVEFKENRLIIFPGCIDHYAHPTICDDNSYRVTLANFINYQTN